MALVAHRVFTCDTGTAGVASVFGVPGQVPYCNPGSGGTWHTVYVHDTDTLDSSNLDYEQLGLAFSAGFVILGAPLIFIMSVRLVLSMFRNHS